VRKGKTKQEAELNLKGIFIVMLQERFTSDNSAIPSLAQLTKDVNLMLIYLQNIRGIRTS
jgi:hypothetical protein